MAARSADQAREQLLHKVTTVIDQINGLLRQMREYILAIASEVGDSPDRLTLDEFESFVRKLYSTDQQPVLGMGFLPDPKALPNGKVLWWYNLRTTATHSSLRPLAVGAVPQAMDFYDALSAEWWQSAANSVGPVASGPFVDISGTNAYVVTFAEAVRIQGELLGVVAADITVSALQRICQNDLLDLPRQTSVVNQEGMVIATNAGALLGSVVEMSDADEVRREPVTGTSWLLIQNQ